MSISDFASGASPRRFSAASKTSGLSRIDLMSCMGKVLNHAGKARASSTPKGHSLKYRTRGIPDIGSMHHLDAEIDECPHLGGRVVPRGVKHVQRKHLVRPVRK